VKPGTGVRTFNRAYSSGRAALTWLQAWPHCPHRFVIPWTGRRFSRTKRRSGRSHTAMMWSTWPPLSTPPMMGWKQMLHTGPYVAYTRRHRCFHLCPPRPIATPS
jgi:hypothetical protein